MYSIVYFDTIMHSIVEFNTQYYIDTVQYTDKQYNIV